jgi:hypothetical protein
VKWLRGLVLSTLLVAACEAPPTELPISRLARFTELVPGVSTEADATRLFGVPYDYVAMPLGNEVLTWTETIGLHSLSVSLVFGVDRRLVKIAAVTSS